MMLSKKNLELLLRKKCLYSELFWSAFSHIRTEYWVFSPNTKNVDQNNSEYGHFSRNDKLFPKSYPKHQIHDDCAYKWPKFHL